jgi:hypothetical protein
MERGNEKSTKTRNEFWGFFMAGSVARNNNSMVVLNRCYLQSAQSSTTSKHYLQPLIVTIITIGEKASHITILYGWYRGLSQLAALPSHI